MQSNNLLRVETLRSWARVLGDVTTCRQMLFSANNQQRQDFCQKWESIALVRGWWNNSESVLSQVRPGESMKLAVILLCVILVAEFSNAPGKRNISDVLWPLVWCGHVVCWPCLLLIRRTVLCNKTWTRRQVAWKVQSYNLEHCSTISLWLLLLIWAR